MSLTNEVTIEQNNEYELTYFLTTDSLESITGVLKTNNVEVKSERELQRVSLAYPIKKQNQAFMGITRFSVSSEVLSKISKELALKQDVLRFFIAHYSEVRERRHAPSGQPDSLRKASGAQYVESPKSEPGGVLTNEELEKQIRSITQ